MYDGKGYSLMSRAISAGPETVENISADFPTLINEVSTGGATPLRTAGMSHKSSTSTALLISKGGDINALDTYGFTPLHRMASNNLADGAKALLEAGAEPTSAIVKIATQSEARDVLRIIEEH